MSSFFSYARQLQTVREGIKADEQKEIFDLEVSKVWPNQTYIIFDFTTIVFGV